MKIKLVECLDWSAEDRPGVMAHFAREFKKRNLNLLALWCYCADGRGKMAAIARNSAGLSRVLKALGSSARKSKCFYLTGRDRAGALVEVLDKLADAGINVECSDALAAQDTFGAVLWVQDKDLSRARKLLKA